MKKDSYELLDDGFLNLYETGIFVRSFEYSAILISKITWYRLFANINKKTWKIFLECSFPKNKLQEILSSLEQRWYMIRFLDKTWNINITFWEKKLERNEEKIKQIKYDLIKI